MKSRNTQMALYGVAALSLFMPWVSANLSLAGTKTITMAQEGDFMFYLAAIAIAAVASWKWSPFARAFCGAFPVALAIYFLSIYSRLGASFEAAVSEVDNVFAEALLSGVSASIGFGALVYIASVTLAWCNGMFDFLPEFGSRSTDSPVQEEEEEVAY